MVKYQINEMNMSERGRKVERERVDGCKLKEYYYDR